MDQLREQLKLNGLPITNTCLEVRVVPDVGVNNQGDQVQPMRKL
jgi:hypothetical protein